MNQLPDFWRTEVWHPLSVHFPIALLLTAFLFKTIGLWSKKTLWSQGGTVLLFFGTIGAWMAVYTGDLADGIVSREICDPTVLKDHENAAFTMAWLFTTAMILDGIIFSGLLKKGVRYIKILVFVLSLIGTGFLAYTGHLGATLVYQQGAGVYQPSSDCKEFNE